MKKHLLIFFLALTSLKGISQEEYTIPIDSLPFDAIINSTFGGKRMKYYGNINLNLNQAFFENWISGGESSLSGFFNLDYHFNYSDRKGWVWDSYIVLSLGGNKIQNSKLKKADDRFEINSQLGKQINPYWNYSVNLNLRTQILPGFRYYTLDNIAGQEKQSQFFSPAIVQLGLGWYYKKNKDSWINLSPLTGRIILVNPTFTKNLMEGKKYFGVEKGQNHKLYLGSALNGFKKFLLMQNISMENKFNIYLNYLNEIQNVDFEINTAIKMKINDRISSNLIIHLLYDHDLIADLQIRELFGVGINLDL
jgi:hypothetical protein